MDRPVEGVHVFGQVLHKESAPFALQIGKRCNANISHRPRCAEVLQVNQHLPDRLQWQDIHICPFLLIRNRKQIASYLAYLYQLVTPAITLAQGLAVFKWYILKIDKQSLRHYLIVSTYPQFTIPSKQHYCQTHVYLFTIDVLFVEIESYLELS